ncbi:MAG: AMP-binding protein [Rhizobiaceae bacterium]
MNDFKPSRAAIEAGCTTLGELFSARVSTCPNQNAVVDGERALTYNELDSRTNQLANFLSKQGLKRGDRVAIYLRNCQEYLEIELACAKLGLIAAALNWRLAKDELAHCIKLVTPKLLITDEAHRQQLNDMGLLSIPSLIVGVDYDAQLKKQFDTFSTQEVVPEDGLIILYTSGTTGMPKGALISHRAMIARAASFVSELCLPTDAGFIAWAPFFHMVSTDHALATLLRGGTVFVVDGYQPQQMMDILEQEMIGWFVLMPGVVGEFAEACFERELKTKHIYTCGAMADLVPRQQIAKVTRALNAPYLNTFGSTETGLAPASGNTLAIGKEHKDLSKKQSAFCELRLVDANDEDVANGQPGEVALRGQTLFSGYWNAPETNAHDFRGGWFHMGDVLRRNEDGTLDYVDRVKYMIKSGGENIYPAEIEQAILKDKRVEEAVVVRKSDAKWGEVPVAFIVARDKVLTAEEVVKICNENLSSYKRPREIRFIEAEELPRSTTGKIQRHLLEERI